DALEAGTAVYLGWLVADDELEFPLEVLHLVPSLTPPAQPEDQAFPLRETMCERRWRVSGFEDADRLNLKPVLLASEESRQAELHALAEAPGDRKSTRLNSSHVKSSYAVCCLTTKNASPTTATAPLRPRRRLSPLWRCASARRLRCFPTRRSSDLKPSLCARPCVRGGGASRALKMPIGSTSSRCSWPQRSSGKQSFMRWRKLQVGKPTSACRGSGSRFRN